MTFRTISIPAYLLDDAELASLHGKAIEIMTELAGEADTGELVVLVNALRAEIDTRSAIVSVDEKPPRQ